MINPISVIFIIVFSFFCGGACIWLYFKRREKAFKDYLVKYPSNKFKKLLKIDDPIRLQLEEAYTIINKNVEKVMSKQSYVENLSHELLTPIAIINGKLELLLQSQTMKPEEFEIIGSVLQHLQKLIKVNKSLILLSKIEGEVFDSHERVDVSNIINEILNLFELQMRDKKLTIRKPVFHKTIIKTNADLLEILLMNLIKNAVVHNIEGGQLNVILSEGYIEIQNTSKNSNTLSSSIFQRFESKSNSKESIGLGLSIVNKIYHYLEFELKYSKLEGLHAFRVSFYK